MRLAALRFYVLRLLTIVATDARAGGRGVGFSRCVAAIVRQARQMAPQRRTADPFRPMITTRARRPFTLAHSLLLHALLRPALHHNTDTASFVRCCSSSSTTTTTTRAPTDRADDGDHHARSLDLHTRKGFDARTRCVAYAVV